jgi:hypothetical protein
MGVFNEDLGRGCVGKKPEQIVDGLASFALAPIHLKLSFMPSFFNRRNNMLRCPSIWKLKDLISSANEVTVETTEG